jgi:hypothetical protein
VFQRSDLKSTEDWYEFGREQGLAAGNAEITQQRPDFGSHETMLVTGHELLDGAYCLLRQPQVDFPSPEHGMSWMSGLHVGVAAAGARVGYSVMVDDPTAGSVLCVFVHRWPRPMDATIN